ncbi:ATP-binding protein [Paraconexibacter sp. AEG42_29]|uniref:sensor histidine kinase n=1 Tax=Paraconexibacter sp. AEG42_29 TaxID=2997339 RepID=UPI00339D7CB5
MTADGLRRRWGSTRARILSAFVVLLAASTVATTLGQRQLLLDRAVDRVDRQLVQEAEEFRRISALTRDPQTNRPLPRTPDVRSLLDAFLARNVPVEGEAFYTFVGGRNGAASAGEGITAAVTRAVLPLAGVGESRLGELDVPGGSRTRYTLVPVTRAGRTLGSLVVVADLGREEREATRAARGSALIALVVLLIATGIAFVVAGRVLAPLRRLRATATSITENDLTQRLEVRGSDELAELARTFNAMLDRLEGAFDSQRAFVSDAGHELRTPITIIRGHLELLGDGEDPDERRETLALVQDELQRMSRLVEDLLTLAKAERSDFLRAEDIDLDELVEELLVKARALGDRLWAVERADPGLLHADRQRLTQAVMNLAANAVQHTGRGDTITLAGVHEGTRVTLSVADTGPGIALGDQARIFDRHQRGGDERRRPDGAGLGLAIVTAIAAAHGGRATVASAPGEGARFAIILPVDPDPEEDLP